jgi:hypothetical protein
MVYKLFKTRTGQIKQFGSIMLLKENCKFLAVKHDICLKCVLEYNL